MSGISIEHGPGDSPPAKLLVMGRILGAFGVKGWVRVEPFTELPGRLAQLASWWIGADGAWRRVPVAEAEAQGARVVARLEGFTQREQAATLRGAQVAVPRGDLPEPGAGEYYQADLIGMQVVNRSGERLGTVEGVLENGAHPVLQLRSENANEDAGVNAREEAGESDGVREIRLEHALGNSRRNLRRSGRKDTRGGASRLIPFVGHVVDEVDLEAGEIRVDWGGGLVIRFDCVTLFPEMFSAVTASGISRRALERGLWEIGLWNPRDFTDDNYRTVDDRPYGGGPGMVMLAEPLEKAIEAALAAGGGTGSGAGTGTAGRAAVIHLSPQGRPLDHARVLELAARERLVLLCGRYEGIDERLVERCVDEELSIGDYVLSGGELAALVLIDAVVRQLPGALGDADSASCESFAGGLLDCPHYTRPEAYRGMPVPPVLLSGHHAHIERWRRKQSLGRTWLRRPELLERRGMSSDERMLLEEFRQEMAGRPSRHDGP